MSKAREKHAQRLNALSLLGKDLTRRSRAHCELCGASGVKLGAYEVEPIPDDPDTDHAIFTCQVCSEQLQKPKLITVEHWRCLNTSVWSEVAPVQVIAIRMVQYLAETVGWAADLHEQLYLEPEIMEWVDLAKI